MNKKITQIQQQILNLLSYALFQSNSSINSNNGMKELTQPLIWEATSQTVLPLVYTAAKSLGYDVTFLQKIVKKILASNMVVEYEHSELHDLLQGHHIAYVTLKGCASASYYPEPELRIMGDVDFLVKKSDLECAGMILENVGFTPSQNYEHEAHIVYHRLPKSTWEMHWCLSGIPQGRNGDRVREYFSNIIETANTVTVIDGCYQVPDAFHHCLVMLIHIAGHMINTGIGLRHLCDWAVFAHRVDVSQWSGELKECGLWRFAKLLTQLSIQYLHMPEQCWSMEDMNDNLLQAMICDIFAGGNFGQKDDQRINQAKLMTDKGKGSVDNKSMSGQLMSVMSEKARAAMPMCKRIPVLLPLGWMYVGGRHILRIKEGKRPQIHVKEMVQGAAQRRNIYREFHLFESE